MDLVGLNVALQDTDRLLPKSENGIRILSSGSDSVVEECLCHHPCSHDPGQECAGTSMNWTRASAVIGSHRESRHHVHLL